MNSKTATEQISRLIQQRNILAALIFFLAITSFFLVIIITFKSERTIMLPSNLNQSRYVISDNKADAAYLEDRALPIAVRLFNLTPENIKQNLKEISTVIPAAHYPKIKPFLLQLSNDTIKKNIISSFIIEKIISDEENQEVIIKGKSIKFFGSHPKSTQKAYKLKFKFNGVELQLIGLEEIKGI